MKLRIAIINIHGLLRGDELEIGRDADNGGQTRYVSELAHYLSIHPKVEAVHIFTRLIDDPDVSSDYSVPIEIINEKLDIRRIPFAGKKYKAKEQLWDHLDDFVSGIIQHVKQFHIMPDWIHSHYADAGYTSVELSKILNIPFAHTGHSLGLHKRNKLVAMGMTEEEGEKKFKFNIRVAAEESILELAEFIVTSTEQEIQSYEAYNNYKSAQYYAIPPGLNTTKFSPYYCRNLANNSKGRENLQRRYWVGEKIEKFLTNPHKPVIMCLSRPDKRKNIHTLIEVYGKEKELQSIANLVIFAGIRKDIAEMPEGEKEVLTEILLLMDKYDLYGKLAIPKKHDVENEVATIYSYCAEKKGVFANLTLYENFGLTIIEAASSGLPVVVTKNGGPAEIIPKCKNGFLVDPMNKEEIKKSLLQILTNQETWKSFSNNGIDNVQKYYSWESHVERYINWVTENLKSSSGKGVKQKENELQIQKRLKTKIKKLIICDIDGTIIHPSENNPGLEELKNYLKTRPDDVTFAVASGRNLKLIKEFLEEYNILVPDILISSVGSEIYYPSKNEYILDKGWFKYLGGRWKRDTINARLKTIKWLTLQNEKAQNKYKISFNYKPEDYDEEQLRQVLGNLYHRVHTLTSHDQFLDVMPRRASKGNAIKYLCHKWNIPIRSVYAAGNSGNDKDMFMTPVKSIIVKNHTKELEPFIGLKNNYLTKGIAAEGVMEGLKHFNVI